MIPKTEKQKSNLDSSISLNGSEFGTIKNNIEFALNNSQSQEINAIVLKSKILKKLAEHNADFTTEEIQTIKDVIIQMLKTGAVIQILEVIAPNDLK